MFGPPNKKKVVFQLSRTQATQKKMYEVTIERGKVWEQWVSPN